MPTRAFRTASQISHDLHSLVNASGTLAKIVTLGRTYDGRTIEAVQISSKPNLPYKALLLGAHHAREWISAEVPALVAERLLTQSGDPPIASLLSQTEIWIVPVVNPDGKEWSHNPQGLRLWRKNRALIPPHTVGGVLYDNTFGVDPNRNYSYSYGQAGGSSTLPEAEIYQGESAFSEAESRAIRNLGTTIQFDRAVNYHSYGQSVFYPSLQSKGPCEAACQQRLADVAKLARQVSDAIRASRGSDYPLVSDQTDEGDGDVSISGDCSEWLFHERKTLALTIELPPDSVPPHAPAGQGFVIEADEIDPIFEENWLGVMALLAHGTSG